ncbi:MAG: DUF1292 domain-containing protein [Epulopiscium sp.]|nr:DUF1292 domain-containing protein [Candidatus Epulonipiscium sp.]
MKETNNTIFLMDEETGEEVEFEIIDAVEEEGERFILVVPIEQDVEEEVAFILKDISKDEKEAVYKLIEEDDEFAKAAAYFMEDNKDYDIEF